MSEIMRRIHTSLSYNTFTVNASAVQISGGPSANWPLTAVSATFWPSYFRQCIRLTNVGATTLYFGPTPGVTSGTGMELLPGNSWTLDGNGSEVLYAISSTAGGSLSMEELQ